MSEKRFSDIWCSETGHIGVTDCGIDKEFTNDEFEDFLNELNDENDILKQQLQTRYIVNKQYEELQRLKKEKKKKKKLIKDNVFGRYAEGSLADLEFKAAAYDDIVKLGISNESEPKVLVVCKQGKRENAKSFCQMFIPFGIAYEIVEMIDDE